MPHKLLTAIIAVGTILMVGCATTMSVAQTPKDSTTAKDSAQADTNTSKILVEDNILPTLTPHEGLPAVKTVNTNYGGIEYYYQPYEVSRAKLFQNHPNPCNQGFTYIKYCIPDTAWIRLDLLNVLGQTVMMMVDTVQVEGIHELCVKVSGLSSGIYFYRIFVKDAIIDTKKMVILE